MHEDLDIGRQRPRETANATRRLRVKKLIAQCAWLFTPRAVAGGEVITVDREVLRPALRSSAAHDRDTQKKVVRKLGVVLDRRLFGATNRALLELKSLQDELLQQADEGFVARAEAALSVATRLLDASESKPSSAARLILETHALWLDADADRPSRKHTVEPSASKALRAWPLDLMHQYGRACGPALPALAKDLRIESSADALRVACLLFDARALAAALTALVCIGRAIESCEHELTARLARFEAVFERSIAATQAATQSIYDRALFKFAWCDHLMLELEKDGVPHAADWVKRDQPFLVLQDLSHWYSGGQIKVPRSGQRATDKLRSAMRAEVDRPRAAWRPWASILSSLLFTRLDADAVEQGARDLAAWIAHTTSATAPTVNGDGPLALAHDVLVGSLSVPMCHLPLLLHHLAVSGADLLDMARTLRTAPLLDPNYYMDRLDPDDAPACWIFGVVPKSVSVDPLLRSPSLFRLARTVSKHPPRAARTMAWLAATPTVCHAFDAWFTGLFNRLLRGSERVFEQTIRASHRLVGAHAESEEQLAALRSLFGCLEWADELDGFIADNFAVVVRLAEHARQSRSDDVPIETCISNRGPLLTIAQAWVAAGYGSPEPMLDARLRLVVQAERNKQAAHYPQTDYEQQLAVMFSNGNLARLDALLALSLLDYGDAELTLSGCELAKTSPAALSTLHAYASDSQRMPTVYRALRSLNLVQKLASVGAVFSPLDVPNDTLPDGVPEAYGLATRLLLTHLKLAGAAPVLPNALSKVLDEPRALRRELQHLQTMSTSQSIQRRMASLQTRIAQPANVEAAFGKALAKVAVHARFKAFESLAQQKLSAHWQALLGAAPRHHEHADWQNALHLLLSVKQNRRLLKQLLRDRARGRMASFRDHAVNDRFLKRMKRGSDWLAPRSLEIKVGAQTLRAYVEQDPLRVLQMGNLFATCLSVGNVNAFSTIANAIEVNKRVLMLEDQAGKIVGRKLIALAPNGVLYGFNSYGSNLSHKHGTPWAKIAFDLLSHDIARAARVRFPTSAEDTEMSINGSALMLFAKWYNDGTEHFDHWVPEFVGDDGRPDRDLVERNVVAFLHMPQAMHLDRFDSCLRALVWLGERGKTVAAKLANLGRLDAAALAYVTRHATLFEHVRFTETKESKKKHGAIE